MVQQAFDRDTGNYILTTIKKGMEVIDRLGKKIGNVTDVYFGESSPEANARGEGAVTAKPRPGPGDSFAADIARVFVDDKLPQVLINRLLRNGFVKIGGEGLLSHAKYVLPNQIDQVAGNRIELRVSHDELVRSDITDQD